MKEVIIAQNRKHLMEIIEETIKLQGINCDLNHIDISNVYDLSSLFVSSEFNGNISLWNTSNVTNMFGIFSNSKFNGDISKWNTSNVTSMTRMFYRSKFNRNINKWNTKNVKAMNEMFSDSVFNKDISNWDVSNVENMYMMFYNAKFKHDLSRWTPYKASIQGMFPRNMKSLPYWCKYELLKERKQQIDKYTLHNQLYDNLTINNNVPHKLKL